MLLCDDSQCLCVTGYLSSDGFREAVRVGQVKDLFIIGGHDEWQRGVYFVVFGMFM